MHRIPILNYNSVNYKDQLSIFGDNYGIDILYMERHRLIHIYFILKMSKKRA